MALSLNLENKVVFITGGTRGIGWAAARAFAGQGARVVINGRRDQDLLDTRVARLTSGFGVEALGLLADAANPSEVKACYQEIFKRFKRLDVLVNNAGVLEEGLIGMISPEAAERVFAVNTLGALGHLQAAARLMGRARAGSIINMSSIIGLRGNAGQAVYSASKAALVGLTLSAAKELGRLGIRVNALAPGFIETEMMEQTPEEVRRVQVERISLGRLGRPDDVTGALLFLGSDMSAYITGQVLGVDGGMVI